MTHEDTSACSCLNAVCEKQCLSRTVTMSYFSLFCCRKSRTQSLQSLQKESWRNKNERMKQGKKIMQKLQQRLRLVRYKFPLQELKDFHFQLSWNRWTTIDDKFHVKLVIFMHRGVDTFISPPHAHRGGSGDHSWTWSSSQQIVDWTGEERRADRF